MKSPQMLSNKRLLVIIVTGFFCVAWSQELLYSIWFPELSSSSSEENFWNAEAIKYWTLLNYNSAELQFGALCPSKLFCAINSKWRQVLYNKTG